VNGKADGEGLVRWNWKLKGAEQINISFAPARLPEKSLCASAGIFYAIPLENGLMPNPI